MMTQAKAADAEDITPVLEVAVGYNPTLAHKDLFTIRTWLRAGFDIDLDIIPAMKRCFDRGRPISCFAYFTSAVTEERDRRLAREVAKRSEAKPGKLTTEGFARGLAWRRKMNLFVSRRDLEWLEAYEAEHGKLQS